MTGRENEATESATAICSSHPSTCSDDRQPAASKPVAMVQPRKVHGVRVLPSPTTSRRLVADAAKPSRLARSPAIRAPRPPSDDTRPLTSRWAGRRPTDPGDDGAAAAAAHDRRRRRYTRRSGTHAGDDCHDAGNWQCRVSTSGCWTSVGQLPAVAEGGPPAGVDGWSPVDSAAHEALLMTKKKDAEIASLLRHIRLSEMSRDENHVRRRPAFNECLIERINFERSLGYFP